MFNRPVHNYVFMCYKGDIITSEIVCFGLLSNSVNGQIDYLLFNDADVLNKIRVMFGEHHLPHFTSMRDAVSANLDHCKSVLSTHDAEESHIWFKHLIAPSEGAITYTGPITSFSTELTVHDSLISYANVYHNRNLA
jgi:hypothetical protein